MKIGKKLNREIINAGWLIGGKILQMLLSLLIGVYSARYLGPSNYGLINYANAYLRFFVVFCTLGLNSIIVKEFIDHPEEQGIALGSSIFIRIVSSLCALMAIISIVCLLDRGETETIIVVAISSLSLVFQSFDIINYWFQAKYKSKVNSIVTLGSYIVTSGYKVVLLVLNKNVKWFAFALSIDYITLAVLLFIAYNKSNGPKLSVSWYKIKSLLGKSHHYIISGMMVAIYGQTDKMMLKQMLDETAVGYYSIATNICGMWVFILQAIIDAVYPTILGLHKKNQVEFERKNKQLYAIIFYISITVSMFFTIFGDVVIRILYGNAYMGAAMPLKVITWYTTFSYLGVARNAWVVCQDKQRYLKYIYMCAAVMNVIMNALFIPKLGVTGAALASLITQICTSIILPLFFNGMRENSILMLQAICLRDVIPKKNS